MTVFVKTNFRLEDIRQKYCSSECRKLANALGVSGVLNSKEGKGGTRKILILRKPFLNMGKHRLEGGSGLIT